MAGSELKVSFIVYNAGGPFDIIPASANIILGQYVEDGWNHGKRVYKRRPTAAQKFLPEVKLFFWDESDGKDRGGWWFGDSIGSGQVWSRNTSMTPQPPTKGWRCPADGPVQESILCVPPVCPPPPPPPPRPLRSVKLEELDEPGRGGPSPERRPPVEALVPLPPPPKRLRVKHEELEAFNLVSTLGRDAPWGTQHLLGDYFEQSENHGRKAYCKLRNPRAPEAEPVWLFYWDVRDGPAQSGWWLANWVGGKERYGRADVHTQEPPAKGWQVPCGGPARLDLRLLPRGQTAEAALQEEDLLAAATASVVDAESEAYRAMEGSQAAQEGKDGVLPEALQAAEGMLKARAKVVEDAIESLDRHGRMLRSEGSQQEVRQLKERLQVVLESVQQELSRTTWRLEGEGGEAPAG